MCLFDHFKLKFYHCFNAIFTRNRNASTELSSVCLLKPVCLLKRKGQQGMLCNKTLLSHYVLRSTSDTN